MVISHIHGKRLSVACWREIVWLLGSLLLTMLLCQQAWAAEISVRSDHDPIAINESFQLIFETADEVDGEPDFSPLKEVLDILERHQSTNIQFVNGQQSRTATWVLTVLAKQVGEVVIPPIHFGRTHTSPVHLVVTEEGKKPTINEKESPDLFVTVETDTHDAYVQGQVVLTVRFFQAIPISGASMSQPTFTGGEVVMEMLGKGRQYQIKQNNRTYRVEEYRYVLFPQASGTLTLNPIDVQVQIGGGNQLFGSFFNDPFGQSSPFSRQKRSVKRLRSDGLSLQIRPIPSEFKGDRWLPAHELIMTEKWSQPITQFKVGEPITRTIIVMADGMPAKQLPALPLQETKGLKQYLDPQPERTDQVENSGIVGSLRQKNAIIPTASGRYTLPTVEIPWWDVDEHRMKVATLPSVTFQVAPSAALPVPTAPVQAQQADHPPSQPTPLSLENPIPPATDKSTLSQESHQIPLPSSSSSWLVTLLAGGWLMTILAWWWHWRTSHAVPTVQKADKHRSRDSAFSMKPLRKSCLDNDSRQCRLLLIQWARAKWPDEKRMGLEEIRQRVSPALGKEVEQLERVLFAQESSPWSGERLWHCMREEEKRLSDQKEAEDDRSETEGKLRPLYPNPG